MIRELQPQALIAFKQGASGDEDFASPEAPRSLPRRSGSRAHRRRPGADRAACLKELNQHKHNEICDTLQPIAWGYMQADDGNHKGPNEVMAMLADAEAHRCNLLLNTGPLPDGSIHPEDVVTLREVGRRLHA